MSRTLSQVLECKRIHSTCAPAMGRGLLLWAAALALPLGASAVAPRNIPTASRASAGDVRVELDAAPPAWIEPRSTPHAQALNTATRSTWTIAWHPHRDVARRGWGGRPRTGTILGADEVRARAERFRIQHADLLGARGATLHSVRWRHAGRAWHATWQQRHAGRRVHGAVLDLTLLEDGTVVGFRSTLAPELHVRPGTPDLSMAVQRCAALVQRELRVLGSETVWVVGSDAAGFEAQAALDLRLASATGGRWRALVAAGTHDVLLFESMLRTSSELTGTTVARVKPNYAQDPYVDVALPHLKVRLGFSQTDPSTFADASGTFRFAYPAGNVTLHAPLAGRFVAVDNATSDPPPYFEAEVAVPGEFEIRFGAGDSRNDERTIYHHVNIAHAFMSERFGFSLLDFPVPAVAAAHDPSTGDPNYPNAHWDGEVLGFGNGGGTFWNLGLYADVIYHEYSHAVTDYMYRPAGDLIGAIGGAIHEALADYFAATLTDDPRMGEHLYRQRKPPLRNLDNALYWPDNRDDRDQVHANGEILGAMLWDTRVALGAEKADAIIHFARELFPRTFDEYLDAMLVQDDLLFGDGWVPNGSPHRDAILHAFAMHGVGPLADDVLELVHERLFDSEDGTRPRAIETRVRARLKHTEPIVRVSYRLAGHVEFERAWLEAHEDGSFRGEIPAFPAGSTVEYYLEAGQYQPVVRIGRLPLGEALFSYRVGPDEQPPQITHVPRHEVASFAWPPNLYVDIEDNVGVSHAYVEYRINDELGGTLGLVADATQRGRYWTRLPDVGGLPGDVLEYWITAVDASDATHVSRFPAVGAVRVAVVQELDDGFEHDQSAWTHASLVTPQPDAWQRTTRWNHTQGGSTAWLCGAEDGDVAEGIAAALVTSWYRIEAGATAQVWSWMQALESAPGVATDGGRVEIQAQGSNLWSTLEPRGGYSHTMGAAAVRNALAPGTPGLSGDDGGWRLLEFDLNAWARQRVRLRFVFGTSHEATSAPRGRGWLLDDFLLAAGSVDPTDSGAAPVPAALRVHAHPNPFNPRVRLRIDVPPRAGRLTLDVVDARGRLLRRLLDDTPAPGAGAVEVIWDGTDASGLASASGVYYYRLHSKRGLESGKLVLVR